MARFKEIQGLELELESLKQAWLDKIDAYKRHVIGLFDKYGMEIVVYDEVEKFRQYSNPLFEYPFEKRKNFLQSVPFAIDVPVSADGKNNEYSYNSDKVNFKIS